jgi:hypothetical protein
MGGWHADPWTPPLTRDATTDSPKDTATREVGAGDGRSRDGAVDVVVDAIDMESAGSCNDRLLDGDETDVDCGGSVCAPCGPDKRCRLDADCSATASGCDAAQGGCRCDAMTQRCVYDHCFDGKLDDGETAIDCGGGVCGVCATGQGCFVDADCETTACDGVSFVCVPTLCNDHRRDGNETDIDCGGSDSCSRCLVGRECQVNSDCIPGHRCIATDASEEVCQ